MAVVREQFGFASALVPSVAATTAQTYTLTRPADAVEGNTIDHVARPRVRKEFNQGKVSVYPNAAILAYAAGAFVLQKIEILDANGAVLRTPLSVMDAAFDLKDAGTQALLKSFILKEDERSIKLTCYNTTGGALADSQFTAQADLGLNAANFGVTLP